MNQPLINPSATLEVTSAKDFVVAVMSQKQPDGSTKKLATTYDLATLQAQQTLITSIGTQLDAAIALLS